MFMINMKTCSCNFALLKCTKKSKKIKKTEDVVFANLLQYFFILRCPYNSQYRLAAKIEAL